MFEVAKIVLRRAGFSDRLRHKCFFPLFMSPTKRHEATSAFVRQLATWTRSLGIASSNTMNRTNMSWMFGLLLWSLWLLRSIFVKCCSCYAATESTEFVDIACHIGVGAHECLPNLIAFINNRLPATPARLPYQPLP